MARALLLDDDGLRELLGVIREADSVELKLTLPESGRQQAIQALGLDPLDAVIRQVFFFDTPDLILYEQGVVVRARRTQGKPDDSVIKLRPVVPAKIPDKLRETKGFGVEVDAMPGGHVCSASFKGELAAGDVKEAIAGTKPIRRLYSKQQRAFFNDHAPDIELDDLSILGPINVFKLKFSPEGFGRKAVWEMWFYPDTSRIIELSTKCTPNEAFEVAAETRAYLTERGLDLSGEQETKTRTALDFYSKELQQAT
jgi:hypothetical protein